MIADLSSYMLISLQINLCVMDPTTYQDICISKYIEPGKPFSIHPVACKYFWEAVPIALLILRKIQNYC